MNEKGKVLVYYPTTKMIEQQKIALSSDSIIFCCSINNLLTENFNEFYYLIRHKYLGNLLRRIEAIHNGRISTYHLGKPELIDKYDLDDIHEVVKIKTIYHSYS